MSSKYRIIPLGGGGMDPSTKYGASISMSMDQDYILSVQLLDQDGNALGSEQTVDLPLESVVVGGSYDSATKSLILTLDNGNTITIPVGDLVSGLQTEITAQNPLSADLVADGTNNKVFTAAEKTKLDGLTVGDGTVTVTQDGQTLGSFTTNQSGDTTIDIPAAGGGCNAWYGTQAQFDALGTYDDDTDYFITDKLDYNKDIKNKPNLSDYVTTSTLSSAVDELDAKNLEQDASIAEKLSGEFITQQEFDAMGQAVPEGKNYFIEGNTVEMVVTFQDQTTATYNVVVD